jgi:CheY-like chemotaxis protein
MGEHMSAERMRSVGLSGYLTKPVRQSRLFDAIISASAQQRHPTLPSINSPGDEQRRQLERLKDLRVLLAEDNDVNQLVASEILARAGCICEVVNNGQEAVDALRRAVFDVVLMDCQMPVMDGFEATRAIRADEQAGKLARKGSLTPIVALTANAVKGDRELCLHAGMDGYVTKPVHPQELLSAIVCVLPDPTAAARSNDAANAVASATPDASDSTKANAQSAAPLAAPIADVPIAVEQLMERCLGNADFCKRILDKFATRSVEQLAEIRGAVERRDSSELKLKAHALKGAAANLSADSMRTMAATLEDTAANGEWDKLLGLVEELSGEVDRCRAYIPKILETC